MGTSALEMLNAGELGSEPAIAGTSSVSVARSAPSRRREATGGGSPRMTARTSSSIERASR